MRFLKGNKFDSFLFILYILFNIYWAYQIVMIVEPRWMLLFYYVMLIVNTLNILFFIDKVKKEFGKTVEK